MVDIGGLRINIIRGGGGGGGGGGVYRSTYSLMIISLFLSCASNNPPCDTGRTMSLWGSMT